MIIRNAVLFAVLEKKSFKIGLTFFFLLICAQQIFAQTNRGETFFSLGGSGVNGGGINFMVDHKLKKNASMGLGFTHTFFGKGMMRENISWRILFNSDFTKPAVLFIGMRLGASYWWSNGAANSYSLLGLQTVKAGSVYPSAQVLAGLRYLWNNGIGFHIEGGIGSPYLVAAGLSANFRYLGKKNRTTDSTIEKGNSTTEPPVKKPRASMFPVERKNVIKLNLSSFALIPSVSYERYLSKNMTLEVGGSFQPQKSWIQSVEVASDTGRHLYESDSLHQVLKAFVQLRFYLLPERYLVPKGLYVGAISTYINRQILVNVEDLSAVPDSRNFDYTRASVFWGAGLTIGYQHIFANRFAIDVYGGRMLGLTYPKPLRYVDSRISESDFENYFGTHLNGGSNNSNLIVFRINIGYNF